MPPCRLPPGTVPGLGVASEAAPGTERNGGGKKRENGRERGKRKTQEFIKPPQRAAGTIGVTGEQRERGENGVKSNLESGNPG